ncbi:hypothetical protein KOR34_20060 [Posidoniimonas corsicana]|uniref:Uncharacterized protein n=1 Tax=Posidoniimonas corsicana TaxID=1938618 RepID=A0A5C5VGN2_9BACT|nr:hypothetical protein [Posidoniimonas corsicana]TWT37059.1 hypothetical protein KOR34_20060 [Posidoniimonas corsicana]
MKRIVLALITCVTLSAVGCGGPAPIEKTPEELEQERLEQREQAMKERGEAG